MSGFSADWLGLREPADHRARAAGLAERLTRHLGHGRVPRVVDLGSGTGSNLRATAPHLGPRQSWRLVDDDPALLEAAARRLAEWADAARAEGETLWLDKGGAEILVSFDRRDLARGVDGDLLADCDLVTASALFDLTSAAWIGRLVEAVVARGAAFLGVLTYDGRDGFVPPHPLDDAVIAAFAAHMKRDKGFGTAAGPAAADVLAEGFGAAGYVVERGDSPWVLGPAQETLARELLAGMAAAVGETGRVPAAGLDDWLEFRRAACGRSGARIVVGHTDILAMSAG